MAVLPYFGPIFWVFLVGFELFRDISVYWSEFTSRKQRID